jgi:Putative peptidoglycan binding domain
MIIMKKLTSLLIGCSLALAGAALAQQPVEQQSPSKGKRAPEKANATQAQPGGNPAKHPVPPETGAPQQHGAKHDTGAIKQPGKTNERSATMNQPAAAEKGQKTHAGRESKPPETNVSGQATSGATNEPGTGKNRNKRATEQSANAPTSSEKQQAEQRKKGMKGQATEKTTTNPAGANPAGQAAGATGANAGATGAGAAPPAPAAGNQNVQPNQNVPANQNMQANAGAKGKKPAPQQVQQVKTQRANFKAQPKPQQVPSVTFNQNHRIEGSDRWQGQQYQVFRSYQPQWHDQGWYHSHYHNVVLIGGGYYFLNNGYWFPAWGYSASAQYYPYDGPIYAGHGAEPPDKVIAQTQDLLQQMGYYKGEVDGLLGPLTRDALTAYQADQGLQQTAAIDEPTLESLGLA